MRNGTTRLDIATIIAGPEVSAAIGWWAGMLGQGTSGAEDDVGNRALTDLVAPYQNTRPPTDDERRRFAQALRGGLSAHWRRMQAVGGFPWDACHPDQGSPMRTLAVDYRPDAVLAAAVLAAGYPLSATVFPIKTTMWINPGRVIVRRGYHGEPITVHPPL